MLAWWLREDRASGNVLAPMLWAKPGHMAKPSALGWREIILLQDSMEHREAVGRPGGLEIT